MNPQQLNWLQALFMFGRHQTIHIYYMKKEQIIRQCYGGMKEKHGMETITLFHVGDSYEAYFEDAETISRIMEAPLFKMTAANIPAVRISDTAMEECRNRLLVQDMKYACPSSGVHPAAIISKFYETVKKAG